MYYKVDIAPDPFFFAISVAAESKLDFQLEQQPHSMCSLHPSNCLCHCREIDQLAGYAIMHSSLETNSTTVH
jgi:hypothetical protein